MDLQDRWRRDANEMRACSPLLLLINSSKMNLPISNRQLHHPSLPSNHGDWWFLVRRLYFCFLAVGNPNTAPVPRCGLIFPMFADRPK